MARVTFVSAKLGNMRKAQDFIVYPIQGSDRVVIQSDTRIAAFNPETGVGVLSEAKPNGAYFMHLSFNTIPIVLPRELVEKILGHAPQVGDTIGGGVQIGASS